MRENKRENKMENTRENIGVYSITVDNSPYILTIGYEKMSGHSEASDSFYFSNSSDSFRSSDCEGFSAPLGECAGMVVTSLSLDPPPKESALSKPVEPEISVSKPPLTLSSNSVRHSTANEKILNCEKESEYKGVPQHKNELTDLVFRELSEYLSGDRQAFTFPILLRGTDFQRKVWKALCEIPYGETRSYKEIAEAVGSPRAYRAVGGANNKNPVAIAVPCHRVIGSDGGLVGYGLGTNLKEKLLKIERRKGEQC